MIKYLAKKIVSFSTHISPEFGCRVIYFMKFHKILNLRKPKEFNEKLMWLKLNNYNNNELVWKCADKYQLRDYCYYLGISSDHFPKLIGVYDTASLIDFDKLPNKFVLKCTHGMGFNIICEDKNKLDYKKAVYKLNKWQKTKFGYESAEVHYLHVKPKIICEEFIENEDGNFPIDYKIYCFNGKPTIVLVCVDRKNHYKTIFYDLCWNKLNLRDDSIDKEINRPKCLDEMIGIASIVSKDFPFVRVDFYEYNGKAILGEMTFTPAACLGKYNNYASLKLGSMLEVSNEKI